MNIGAPSVVALITARGGSKGLPRKNVLPLAGQPLIAHTIRAAQQAACVTDVYVTTDDAEIAAVSRQFSAPVIDRPAELATDTARSEEVVLQALTTLGEQGHVYDYFVLLQPTSPLRTAQHIDECWQQWQGSDSKTIVAVTEVEHHPYKDYVVEQGQLKPLFTAHALHQSRAEYPHVVRQTGAIYMMSVVDFRREKTFFIPPVMPYFMSQSESVDIDTALDLRLAEQLLV